MSRPTVITADDLAQGLSELHDWTGDLTAITRTVELGSFPEAIAFVNEVAMAAEEADHHPDIDIRWRTLRFTLSTHDAGGVTMLDLELAGVIDDLLDDTADSFEDA